VRTAKQIVDCAVAGADIVTAGWTYIARASPPYTRQGIETFAQAWDNTAVE
jgi:transaldolase